MLKFSSCIKNFRLGGQKNRTGIGAHLPAPGAPEPQRFQALTLAMSGGLKLNYR
jgi:hypothetical protein